MRDLRPPLRPPKFLLVGRDPDGIGAISYRTEVAGPGQVHLELMAIANRHRRRRSGFLGDELAQVTLDEAIDRAVQEQLDHVRLTTHVHPDNKASKRLCERMELERTGQADSGYEVWSADLYLLF